ILLRIASASRFGISWSSAICAAMWRKVTVEVEPAALVEVAPLAAAGFADPRGALPIPVDAFFAAIAYRLASRGFRIPSTESRFLGENKSFRRKQRLFRVGRNLCDRRTADQ